MDEALEEKRSIGLAALLVIGALTGFIVASTVTGAEYATVGTIAEDNRAYSVPVHEDTDRLRFALEAGDGPATPEVRFAVYDPADDFFGQFALSGSDDRVETVTEATGDWVVFVTKAQNAELAVQHAAQDGNSSAELTSLKVVEERTEIAHQDGGALDKHVALEVDHRPAAIELAYEGTIENLDATVETDEGIAYELENAQANETHNASTSSADVAKMDPANLAEGTYEVQAQADAFDGRLDLVRQDYVRTPDKDLDDATKREKIEAARNGTIVAQMGEDEAHEIDTAGAQRVLFVVRPDNHAHVSVFDEDDQFVDAVSLGSSEDGCEDGVCRTDTNNSRIAQFVELDEPGNYVAYVSSVEGDDATVYATVPQVDNAPKATQLDVEQENVTFEVQGVGQYHAKKAMNFTGALVETSVESREAVNSYRNVTVTTELGLAFAREDRTSTFGYPTQTSASVYPDRYTDGQITVEIESDWSAAEETTVELTHYER